MQRHITVDLTQEEYDALKEYIKDLSTWCDKPTAKELLHGFIGDLTDTADCGGSDEFFKAREYVSRRWEC